MVRRCSLLLAAAVIAVAVPESKAFLPEGRRRREEGLKRPGSRKGEGQNRRENPIPVDWKEMTRSVNRSNYLGPIYCC